MKAALTHTHSAGAPTGPRDAMQVHDLQDTFLAYILTLTRFIKLSRFLNADGHDEQGRSLPTRVANRSNLKVTRSESQD